MIDFLGITGGKGGQAVGAENTNPAGELSFIHALTREAKITLALSRPGQSKRELARLGHEGE